MKPKLIAIFCMVLIILMPIAFAADIAEGIGNIESFEDITKESGDIILNVNHLYERNS